MADRFERLFSLPGNLYSVGSPVIVVAGALLKDTQSGNVIVQLKFQSVTSIPIKALKVNIAAFDSTGEAIESVHEYQYLDLKVQSGVAFGAKKAIVMPNPVTRSFELCGIRVVLENGDIQDVYMPLSALPQSKTLQSVMGNEELVKQYRIAINENASYTPKEIKNIWRCSCGVWNGLKTCTYCGADKAVVFNCFDPTYLAENAKRRLKKEKVEQEARAAQEKVASEERAKRLAAKAAKNRAIMRKVKMMAAIIIPISILALLFAFWIYPDIIRPNSEYKAAQLLLTNGKYDDAVAAFSELYDYKDSGTMVNESLYQKANSLLSVQNYDDAIIIFESIAEYKDSLDRINKAKYQKACYLAETGNLKDAISILKVLDGYAESDAELDELNYQYAGELLSKGSYDKAKAIFQSIEAYKDSITWVQECDYLMACEYYSEKKYSEAATLFKTLKQYKDSESKVTDCTYHSALSFMNKKQYTKAIELFEEITNYEDASELAKECKYLQAKQNINTGNYTAAKALFTTINGYKDSSNYLSLLSDVVSIVLAADAKYSSSTEYIWVASEIDTKNCTSRLVVYEGRADGTDDTIDVTYRDGKDMRKLWKIEGGRMIMTSGGVDYHETPTVYAVWSVSDNWSSIYEQIYFEGSIFGSPGEYVTNWKKVDDDKASIIKKSFIHYFEEDEYGKWDEKYWITAKGALD